MTNIAILRDKVRWLEGELLIAERQAAAYQEAARDWKQLYHELLADVGKVSYLEDQADGDEE